LGNQFLSHIREVDAIAHVVRIFDNANIASTQDMINPMEGIELINTELALSDLAQKDEKQKLTNKPVLYVLNKEAGGHNLDETPHDERWEKLMNFFNENNLHYVVVDAGVDDYVVQIVFVKEVHELFPSLDM